MTIIKYGEIKNLFFDYINKYIKKKLNIYRMLKSIIGRSYIKKNIFFKKGLTIKLNNLFANKFKTLIPIISTGNKMHIPIFFNDNSDNNSDDEDENEDENDKNNKKKIVLLVVCLCLLLIYKFWGKNGW